MPGQNLTRLIGTRPFAQELPALLTERGTSLRSLARSVGVSQPHLSSVLAGRRPISTDLLARVTRVLELPLDYFPEMRERALIEHLRSDPELRDRLYRRYVAGR